MIWSLRFSAIVFLMMIFASPPVGAASADAAADFHTAQADAYSHYREALFYARRGNAMTASLELEAMREKWAGVISRFASQPPRPYAADPKWRETLESIGERVDLALKLSIEGDARAAWQQLKPIRERLADLRRRNGVVIFSDHINAANAAFKHLFEFRRKPPDLNNPGDVKDLKTRVAATLAAYKNSFEQAPPEISASEQFQRLIDDSLTQLGRIDAAIADKNQLGVINILRRVISSDNLIWLHFG